MGSTEDESASTPEELSSKVKRTGKYDRHLLGTRDSLYWDSLKVKLPVSN